MRIASRMDVIGTESVFGAAARARVLKATASYANSREDMTEALARIRSVVGPLVAAQG